MAKVHDKFVIELAEVIKGYGNDPDVDDPFHLSEFYRFYELPEIAVSANHFKTMIPLTDVQPVVQWIPCSERLPEEKINPNTQDYDWVLCSTTFGDVRAYNFGRGRFLHGCGDVTQYVIAWMPLPEPYRAERRTDEGSDK